MFLLNTEKVHADILNKKKGKNPIYEETEKKKSRKDPSPDMLFRAMPFPLTGFRLTVEGQSDHRPNPTPPYTPSSLDPNQVDLLSFP